MGSHPINSKHLSSFENVKIRENSWIAAMAAARLKAQQVAIVIGSTIHLHNTKTATFLQHERWVKHEACHLAQFRKHGRIKFILLYLIESCRQGYHNNKFEVEARLAENISDLPV